MVPFEHWSIYVSFLFYVATEFLSYLVRSLKTSMPRKIPVLTSIPENEEFAEEIPNKWVPKKKHEVLKAKYKCLKKLFQIYDANLIGILPDPYENRGDSIDDDTTQGVKHKRKKKIYRNQTDVTSESSETQTVNESFAIDNRSSIATSVDSTDTQTPSSSGERNSDKSNKESISDDLTSVQSKECECTQTSECPSQHLLPYFLVDHKPKLNKFQRFIERIFGVKLNPECRGYVMPNGHVLAASDNSIEYGRRRKRGLSFRRRRKKRKTKSETALLDARKPVLLNYVLSIQRHYLKDTTPRQCPIIGCKMMFYGIINYNDHLNLCHFPERKHVCNYCHDGFEHDSDRVNHENEHIGINKLKSSSPTQTKKASVTQTESAERCNVPEEKLKKIVSFFDKMVYKEAKSDISDTNGFSEPKIVRSIGSANPTLSETVSESNQKSVDSSEVKNASFSKSVQSLKRRTVKCNLCGESFNSRRQLSLHAEMEHKIHGKFSKFHSSAGILSGRKTHKIALITEHGKIQLESSPSMLKKVDTASTLEAGGTREVGPYKWKPGAELRMLRPKSERHR